MLLPITELEYVLDGNPEMACDLQRYHGRWHESSDLNGTDGLARDPDGAGQIGLAHPVLGAKHSDAVVEVAQDYSSEGSGSSLARIIRPK